jgi:hypothetical protein
MSSSAKTGKKTVVSPAEEPDMIDAIFGMHYFLHRSGQ